MSSGVEIPAAKSILTVTYAVYALAIRRRHPNTVVVSTATQQANITRAHIYNYSSFAFAIQSQWEMLLGNYDYVALQKVGPFNCISVQAKPDDVMLTAALTRTEGRTGLCRYSVLDLHLFRCDRLSECENPPKQPEANTDTHSSFPCRALSCPRQ
eukprot:2126786-Rhodomonas_salina.5